MKSPQRGTCAVAWLLAASLAGCFNSAARSPDAGAPVSCNDLLPPSDSVVEATSAGSSDVPVAVGGEMPAGLFHLVSSLYYPAPRCTVAGVATRLKSTPASSPSSPGTIEIITASAGGNTLSESVSYTVSGTSLTVRIDCISPNPAGLAGSGALIPFNATANEIQLYKATPACGASIDTYQLEGV